MIHYQYRKAAGQYQARQQELKDQVNGVVADFCTANGLV